MAAYPLVLEIMFPVVIVAHHPNYHDLTNFPLNHYDSSHYPPEDDPINNILCNMIVLTGNTGCTILTLVLGSMLIRIINMKRRKMGWREASWPTLWLILLIGSCSAAIYGSNMWPLWNLGAVCSVVYSSYFYLSISENRVIKGLVIANAVLFSLVWLFRIALPDASHFEGNNDCAGSWPAATF